MSLRGTKQSRTLQDEYAQFPIASAIQRIAMTNYL
jgi:hypothetical protein